MDQHGVPERPTLSHLNPRRDQLSNGSRGLRKGYPSPNLSSGSSAFGYVVNGSIKSSSSRDNGPLDDTRLPQASSTSAAVGSPTFYTGGINRGATKRFNSVLADYSDDRAVQPDEQDASHNTHTRPKSPVQEYNPSFRLLPATQKSWWLQPAFRVRRKRSIFAESTAYERATRFSSASYISQLSRRQPLGILFLTVLALYFVFRRGGGPKSRSGTVIDPVLEPSGDRTALFERKWWEPPFRSGTASLRKRAKKRTSFVTPRHTLEELLRLPSRYMFKISEKDDLYTGESKHSHPIVAAVLDCSLAASGEAYSSTDFVQHTNSLLQALSQGTSRPHSIILLFPSIDASRTAELLFGYEEGWLSVHVAGDPRAALSVLQSIQADFLLFLPYPGPSSASVSSGSSDMIQQFLHVAGTVEYEDKILSTSGLRISTSTPDKARVMPVPAQAIRDSARKYLEESERVHIPVSPFLLRRAWLDDISAHSLSAGLEGETLEIYALLGLGSQIAVALHGSLQVESYALPIASEDTGVNGRRPVALLADQSEVVRRLAAYAGWQKPSTLTSDADVEQIGNPAKVAVFLPASTAKLHESLETLVCRFSSEQTFGHEVRVFVPNGSDLIDTSLAACPEVELESGLPEVIEQWKPEICLSYDHEAISTNFWCAKIVISAADIAYADWLASLPLESLQNWHTPRIDLVVITNNRPHSLQRLLTSLSSAIYFNDTVNLNINLEQTADGNTSQLVYDASWPYGSLSLRRRIILGELMPSIVESWYPANNDSYGVLLEDDVEVSPHFYAWIKFSILQYRYGPRSSRVSSRSMAGVSLYQPKNLELRMEGRRKFDAHRIFADIGISATIPYLSQIPCSWGAVYFPEHWKEFHQYLILRLGEVAMDLSEPIVPDIRSNRWHKSWKRYMIELMYLRGYSMLYPNYQDLRSLSTNHLELGTHVKDFLAAQKRKASFEVPLLQLEDTVLEGLLDDRLPSWDGLPLLDFWGGLVTHGEVLQRASITLEELALCPAPITEQQSESDQEDLPEVIYRYDASELLCPRAVPTTQKAPDSLTAPGQTVTAEDREALLAKREAAVLERETRLAELEELGFDFSGEEVVVDA